MIFSIYSSLDLAISSDKPKEYNMLAPTLEEKLSPASVIKGSSDHIHSTSVEWPLKLKVSKNKSAFEYLEICSV